MDRLRSSIGSGRLESIIRMGKRGVEPKMICGGDRAVSRLGVAGVDDAGEVGAIDGQRNSFAEFGGAKPGLFVLRESGSGHLVEPHELGVEAGACVVGRRGRLFLEAVEEIGIERIDEMNFAPAKAKDFNVVIVLDIEAN